MGDRQNEYEQIDAVYTEEKKQLRLKYNYSNIVFLKYIIIYRIMYQLLIP